ncbi:hypothetical protein [Tenacibaculum sp. SG-28]|nr:hypothetical protein [Tenacibaculum sp. SG-28]
MKNLNSEYESAKHKANTYMKNGQISKYFTALLEMNRCKRLMLAVVAN